VAQATPAAATHVPPPAPPAPAAPPTRGPVAAPAGTKGAANEPAKPAGPQQSGQAGGKKHKGRADRTVRVPDPVRPEPVRRKSNAPEDLPRTARPAEVVAVHTSRTPTPADLPKGRRARRRAEKLAAERAEQEERLARQRERDAASMGKREREHIAWVKRLTDMPADPSLNRDK
jgi:hypothetical protein